MVSSPKVPARKEARAVVGYGIALLACAVTTLLAAPFHEFLEPANTVMLFLLTVVLVAVYLGRGPAVLAAFCSVALFDFFFVAPRFSFAVRDAQYLLVFAVMLAVALIISHLTAGLRRQAEEARERERQSIALYTLASALAGAASAPQVLEAVSRFVSTSMGAQTTLLLPADDGELHALVEPQPPLALVARITARSVYDSGHKVESDRSTADDSHRLFLPLRGATRTRGVLVVTAEGVSIAAMEAYKPMLDGVAALVATAVERLHFVDVAQDSKLTAESERLRSSILSALSHDVRTPLTALYGLADTLVLTTQGLPPAARETAGAICDQAARVNSMVGNLLDMARLQAGRVTLRKEWQPLEEVVGASLKLLAPVLASHTVRTRLAPDLPLLEFDAVLMERVLCNLLENAAKYSPAGSAITLAGLVKDGDVEVSVTNTGSQFPPDKLEQVFRLFERGVAESSVAGAGVGLAICRAIVEAHGGRIAALNLPEGAACVRFTLPLGTPPSIEAEIESAGAGL